MICRVYFSLSDAHFDESESQEELTFADEKIAAGLKWRDLRNTRAAECLKALLRDCKVLSLSGWAGRRDASDLWDGLRLDVIRTLNRRDLKFIFSLGDPADRSVYEVDEILDIISDFSLYGRVSLLLKANEAEALWRIIHGHDVRSNSIVPELGDICQEILVTLQINLVIVLDHDRVIAHAREGKVEFGHKDEHLDHHCFP